MAASKNAQRVAGLLTAMAMIVKPQCDEAAILASPCDASSPANGGWIVILGSSMAFIDGTVVRCAADPAVRPGRDDSGSSLGRCCSPDVLSTRHLPSSSSAAGLEVHS